MTEFLSCLMQGEWLPGVLHDTIIASKTKWWGLFPRRISKPHTFFYVKTLFVPAIAFFMGKNADVHAPSHRWRQGNARAGAGALTRRQEFPLFHGIFLIWQNPAITRQ
ncbi:MAG TPA: hypothetical protein DD422_10375 [Akkermansia sp.]|nr:hypothetical protein [Akkermansia sp.]